MLTRSKSCIAVACLAAAIFVGSALTGCVTPRHINDLSADVAVTQRQNDRIEKAVARMDSIIAAGADEDSRLRAEVSTAVTELGEQIAMLLENYNELMVLLNRLDQKPTRYIVDSKGAQTQPPPPTTTTPVEVAPAYPCDSTYDEGFIMVRRGEYENAVAQLQQFLDNCPDHANAEFAYYWLGESYYLLEKFDDAIASFKVLIDNYKSSVKVTSALYKTARSHQEQDRKDEAKAVYQSLVDDYPGTFESEQAKERLKLEHMIQREFPQFAFYIH